MKDMFNECVSRIFNERTKRRRLIYIMLVLSLIASACVFWTLHRVGIAMTADEFICGKTEHTHSDECSPDGYGCTLEEHTHTAECTADISADIETEEVWTASLPDGLSDSWRENMAAIALSQIGFRESERNFTMSDSGEKKGCTRYGQWYGNPYGDWNTMFVYFCMYYSGVPESAVPYGSGCRAWTETLDSGGLLLPPDFAWTAPGDVVFLDTDSDGRADRAAVVTDIPESEGGFVIYAAEGDSDNAVALKSYLRSDERITGWLSLEQPAEFEASAQLTNDINYLAGEYVLINGKSNSSTKENRTVFNSGKKIVVEITLDKKVNDTDYYNPYAYFEKISEEIFNNRNNYTTDENGYEISVVPGIASWQYFRLENSYFYTHANSWISSSDIDGGGRDIKCDYNQKYVYDPLTDTAKLVNTITPFALEYGDMPYNIDFFSNGCKYTGHDNGYTGSDNMFFRIEPPKIKILTDGEGKNTHQTRDTAYTIKAGQQIQLYAEADFDESSREVDSTYELTDSEIQSGMRLEKLTDGGYIATYAGFSSFGAADPPDSEDSRIAYSAEYERDGDKLKITATYEILEAVEDYRYNIIEFSPAQDPDRKEQLWLDILLPDSTGSLVLHLPSDPEKHGYYKDDPYTIEARKTIVLKGTTTHFTAKTKEDYALLDDSDYEKRKYMRVSYQDNPNDYYYLKTDAKFWSYDREKDENGQLKDTAVSKGTIVYNINGDTLEVYVEYTANELENPELANIVFFDGTPVSANQEWQYYQTFYVKVNKYQTERTALPMYVKTEQGWKEKDRINEYVDRLSFIGSENHKDDYILNSKNHPYYLYPGDLITIGFPEITDGSFSCSESNNITDTLKLLNVVRDTSDTMEDGSPAVINGKPAAVITYRADTDNTANDPVLIQYTSEGEVKGEIWVKVITKDRMDHCDIEIADGGTYTFVKNVIMSDGSRCEICEVYESLISGVNYCYIYDKNGEPVRRVDENNEPIGDERVIYTAANYTNNGRPGSTQFEFTSKYKPGTYDGINDVRYIKSDVKSVKFDVQLTLTPYKKKVFNYDSAGNLTSSTIESFGGCSLILNKVDLSLDGQSITDAVNKCPDHSGLDFTFVDSLRSVVDIKAGETNIEAVKKYIKINTDGKKIGNMELEADQFTFKITDLQTDNEFYVKNNADGSISLPVHFSAEGNYYYTITEISGSDGKITYDDTVYKIWVEVNYIETQDADGNITDRMFEAIPHYQLDGTDEYSDTPPDITNKYLFYELPVTGGTGTAVYFAAGGILAAAALAALVCRRKNERKNHEKV